MTKVLSRRGLNRATLARQYLMWQGTWQIRDQALRIQPFTTLRRADRDALLTEAAQLCAFLAPRAEHDIVLDKP